MIMKKSFLCIYFMDQDGVKVHKLANKKRTGPICRHLLTKQAWSIEYSCGLQGTFSCRTQPMVQSRQDSSILPALGSQSQSRI